MAATQEAPEAREVVVGAVGALAQVRADSGTMCSSAMPAALLGIVGLRVSSCMYQPGGWRSTRTAACGDHLRQVAADSGSLHEQTACSREESEKGHCRACTHVTH